MYLATISSFLFSDTCRAVYGVFMSPEYTNMWSQLDWSSTSGAGGEKSNLRNPRLLFSHLVVVFSCSKSTTVRFSYQASAFFTISRPFSSLCLCLFPHYTFLFSFHAESTRETANGWWDMGFGMGNVGGRFPSFLESTLPSLGKHFF